MQRLYTLVPDITSARQLVDELQLAGVPEHHIHLVARDHHPLEQAQLPEATVAEETDFVPIAERGAAAGGATGLLGGLVAVTFPPAGLVLGGAAVLGVGLAGAGLGALLGGWLGARMPSRRLKAYQRAIEDGELLVMVDVAKARAAAVDAMFDAHRRHWDEAGGGPPAAS